MLDTDPGAGPHPFARASRRQTDTCWCGQDSANLAIHPADQHAPCTVCGCYPAGPRTGCSCVVPSCPCPDTTRKAVTR